MSQQALSKAERADSENKYEYQANVNTLIGSLRDRLAEAFFNRNSLHRELKLLRIIAEIQKSVVAICPDDGTPQDMRIRKSPDFITTKSQIFDGITLWIVVYFFIAR